MAFKVYLANTRGMCAGVERAIKTVEVALQRFGRERVYVLHEVVHNQHVVRDLEERGAHFVESLAAVPPGAVLIFSAHGVGIETFKKAQELGFTIIDATCPLVKRIHFKMNKASQRGYDAVVIGHEGHQEVLGTIGQYAGDPARVHIILTPEDVAALQLHDPLHAIFATQTTLSVDETALTVRALKERFPAIEGPLRDDTCFATQHRQSAIKELASLCDLILVAGSANSSNSNRLREVAQKAGCRAFLVDDCTQVDLNWLAEARAVGVSAGASVPEYVVDDLLAFLKEHGMTKLESVGQKGSMHSFALPAGLDKAQ